MVQSPKRWECQLRHERQLPDVDAHHFAVMPSIYASYCVPSVSICILIPGHSQKNKGMVQTCLVLLYDTMLRGYNYLGPVRPVPIYWCNETMLGGIMFGQGF